MHNNYVLCYQNNLDAWSLLALFANDMLLHKVMRDQLEVQLLQRDIDLQRDIGVGKYQLSHFQSQQVQGHAHHKKKEISHTPLLCN